MLKVKDLIKFLETLDLEANLAYGEQNGAMVGEGYWQHIYLTSCCPNALGQ